MAEFGGMLATWLFGAVVCGNVFSAIGTKKTDTFGDSWTGDTALDCWSVILWPVSLMVLAALLVGNAIVRRI